jgi:hypothetical protein
MSPLMTNPIRHLHTSFFGRDCFPEKAGFSRQVVDNPETAKRLETPSTDRSFRCTKAARGKMAILLQPEFIGGTYPGVARPETTFNLHDPATICFRFCCRQANPAPTIIPTAVTPKSNAKDFACANRGGCRVFTSTFTCCLANGFVSPGR